MAATLHERYNVGDVSAPSIYDHYWRGQTFLVGFDGINENHNITSIKLKLFRHTAGTGTFYVSIKAVDGAGKPTGSDLSTGTYLVEDLTEDGDGEWYEISMSSYELQASTEYAIIVNNKNNTSADSIWWKLDNSSPIYSGGKGLYSNTSGTSWFTPYTTYDFMFEVWGEAAAAGTNMKINIGDTFKDVSEMKINIGDSWKAVTKVQQNIGDAWKTVF